MATDAVFVEIVQATQRLSGVQKSALLYHLQQEVDADLEQVTREMILAEHHALRVAGAFAKSDSLLGKYAQPGLTLTQDEMQTTIREAATAWKAKFDGFDTAK